MGKQSRRPAFDPRRRAATFAVKILRGQISDPTPEERLWLAVIEQAVREAYGEVSTQPSRSEDARQWLESEEFDEVAKGIGLHPQWARDTVRKLDELGTVDGPSQRGPAGPQGSSPRHLAPGRRIFETPLP